MTLGVLEGGTPGFLADRLGGLAPAGWAPTTQILVPNLVGGVLAQELTLRITAEGAKATWGVDDVYVDPFRQR